MRWIIHEFSPVQAQAAENERLGHGPRPTSYLKTFQEISNRKDSLCKIKTSGNGRKTWDRQTSYTKRRTAGNLFAAWLT